jgi:hypothetical protein
LRSVLALNIAGQISMLKCDQATSSRVAKIIYWRAPRSHKVTLKGAPI